VLVIITSPANPLVKRIRKLADRKQRRAEGVFVVDGIQPVWRAIDAGADIETLVVAPELIEGGPAERMVAEFEASGGPVTRLGRAVFASISEREGPTGVAAIVRQPAPDLADLPVGPDSVFVALYEVANPGNLGTIIRTADSFGVGGVLLVGPSADPYAPAAVKATMGSLFALPVVPVVDVDAMFDWATAAGVSTVATSARGPAPAPDVPFPKPLLALFGSEGGGLPSGVVDRSDLAVRIPMRGTASSLNLAVAAGIVLYLVTA
jgi:TrmH family RNA methyltransferase